MKTLVDRVSWFVERLEKDNNLAQPDDTVVAQPDDVEGIGNGGAEPTPEVAVDDDDTLLSLALFYDTNESVAADLDDKLAGIITNSCRNRMPDEKLKQKFGSIRSTRQLPYFDDHEGQFGNMAKIAATHAVARHKTAARAEFHQPINDRHLVRSRQPCFGREN